MFRFMMLSKGNGVICEGSNTPSLRATIDDSGNPINAEVDVEVIELTPSVLEGCSEGSCNGGTDRPSAVLLACGFGFRFFLAGFVDDDVFGVASGGGGGGGCIGGSDIAEREVVLVCGCGISASGSDLTHVRVDGGAGSDSTTSTVDIVFPSEMFPR